MASGYSLALGSTVVTAALQATGGAVQGAGGAVAGTSLALVTGHKAAVWLDQRAQAQVREAGSAPAGTAPSAPALAAARRLAA